MTADLLNNFTVSSDDFLGLYEKLIRETVIPYQEKALNDQIEGAEKSHAFENFRAAAKMVEEGKCEDTYYGMVFQDSDLAKWLEAAAYSLRICSDPALEKRCDELIDLIGRAQNKDGYLNTYFTVKEPGKRWTNLEEAHELYCAGHMMEAAVAYAECTGKTRLLIIMSRMADHIYQHFIEEGAEGYPGHPEIELALMRMYRFTNNEKYKTLAGHFINVRGVDSDYYARENERNPWTIWGRNSRDKEYRQNFAPVREQKDAAGHAVRAVYLYTGMADVAAETKDESLKAACKTLWESITQRRMYVTGAIGSAYEGERFTKDYHLPNDAAYAETCASIGLVFFARKMLDLEKNGEYADVMERALYNSVLSGIQLDGTRFFYVNPLESIPGISGEAVSLKHSLPQRPKWFSCACCPPNAARLLTSIGRYAWSREDNTVYSHLFVGGTLDLTDTLGGKITAETGYPCDGSISYRFCPSNGKMRMTLAVRLPQWSAETKILLNGRPSDCERRNGYAYLAGEFGRDDIVEAVFDMRVRRMFASQKVSADSGRVSFSRGPLVYCLEGTDNGGEVLDLYVKKDAEASTARTEKLNGITEILIDGYRAETGSTLYSFNRPETKPCRLTLIPYYTWANRGLSPMRVWIPETE